MIACGIEPQQPKLIYTCDMELIEVRKEVGRPEQRFKRAARPFTSKYAKALELGQIAAQCFNKPRSRMPVLFKAEVAKVRHVPNHDIVFQRVCRKGECAALTDEFECDDVSMMSDNSLKLA